MSGRPPHSACSPTRNAPSTSPPRARQPASTDGTGSAGEQAPVGPGLNGSRGTLFLHVTTADLAQNARTGGTGGRVEKLGPATLQLLADWIGRFSTVTIRPVLDLARD